MDDRTIVFMIIYFVFWAIYLYAVNLSFFFNKKTDGKYSPHPYYTLASQLEGSDKQEFQSIYNNINLRTNIILGLFMNFIILGLGTLGIMKLLSVDEIIFGVFSKIIILIGFPFLFYLYYSILKYGDFKPEIITWNIFLNKPVFKIPEFNFKDKTNSRLNIYFQAREYLSRNYPNKPHYVYDLLSITPGTYITDLNKVQEKMIIRLLINDSIETMIKPEESTRQKIWLYFGLIWTFFMTFIFLYVFIAPLFNLDLYPPLLPNVSLWFWIPPTLVGCFLFIYFYKKILHQQIWTKLNVIYELSNHGIQSNEDTVIEDLLQFSIKKFNKSKLEYVA